MSEQAGSASQGAGSSKGPYGITPNELTVRTGTLSYCTGGDHMDETNWQLLEDRKGKILVDNVDLVAFRFSLSVTQGPKKASCTVKWTGMNIMGATVSPEKVQFECIGNTTLETSGPEEQVSQIPLAKHYKSFRFVRLSLRTVKVESKGGTKGKTVEAIMSHLRVHLTGDTTLNVQDRWHPAAPSVKPQISAFTLSAGEEQRPVLPVTKAEQPLPALPVDRKRPVDAEALKSMDAEELQAEKTRRQAEHMAACEIRLELQRELSKAQKTENEKLKSFMAVWDEEKRRKNQA